MWHFVFAVLIAAGMPGCVRPLEIRDEPRSVPLGTVAPMPSPSASVGSSSKASAEPSLPPAQPADASPLPSNGTAAPAAASSAARPVSPPLATVEGDRIRTAKPIVFIAKNDTIALPESAPVLDAVADLLRSNPTLRIEIRVHIDNADDMGYSRNPSQVRARGVKSYLISRGVDADRLTAKGYGATQPLTLGKTPAERAQNRRTELVLQRVP